MNGLSFFSCSIGSSLWQPILGFNRADLHTPPLFSILALQNGLEDRNADARKILNGRNLVRFRPVTREFTRLNVYSMSINLLLELVLLRSLDGGTGIWNLSYHTGVVCQVQVVWTGVCRRPIGCQFVPKVWSRTWSAISRATTQNYRDIAPAPSSRSDSIYVPVLFAMILVAFSVT